MGSGDLGSDLGADLELGVLGSVVVVRGGSEVPVTRRRHRLLLARLAIDAGRAVPAERLVDEIWGASTLATRTGALRTYVWELRRLLDPDRDPSGRIPAARRGDVLVAREGGYLLAVDPLQIDSARFEARFADGRAAAAAGRYAPALGYVDEALALWRGAAYGDVAEELPIRLEAERLDELALAAQELRAELRLALGRPAEVAAELGVLTRAHPQRERLWAMLMTALYRLDRQGDALRCFQEARAVLIETLGIEPGHELRELEQAILHQDPALDWRPLSGPGGGDGFEERPHAGSLGTRIGTGSADRAGPRGPAVGNEAADHGFPRPLTSLVGRDTERAAVARALEGSRLVTLSGCGGCGKTRLALAVAEDVAPRFPGGAWFVDLAAVSDPDLVVTTVARALGVDAGPDDPLDPLCRRIGDRRALLVVDNCEHVVETVTTCIEHLLAHCPSLHVLATSREELRSKAETVWRVPGLALSRPDGDPSWRSSDAVRLFVERGGRALPGFAPTGEALEAVAYICWRLDGLPLAIELAAALVGVLPVVDIAGRLDDRFRLLDEGFRPSVPHHRALQATLDWSFELLDEPARVLLAELGVFAGDFSLAAAEAVAGPGPDSLRVTRDLGRLVRSSMVDCVSGTDGTQRYRLLETIREYARARLDERDTAGELQRRHARYYTDFAVEAERHVHGPAASRWLARVVSELTNLRAALSWAMAQDEIETGLRLAGSLHWFFSRMALLDEVAPWLDVGLRRRSELAPDLRLKAVAAAGTVAFMRGEPDRAAGLGDEAIALARRLRDTQQLATALIVRGGAAVFEGELAHAERCFREAEGLCTRLGNRWGRAWLLTGWSIVDYRRRHIGPARRRLEEAIALFGELDDLHGQVMPLLYLALVTVEEGDAEGARRLAGDAVRIARRVDALDVEHVALCMGGLVELATGRAGQARDLLLRSIRGFPRSYNKVMVVVAVQSLAVLAAASGRLDDRCVALFGFVDEMLRRWQISRPERYEPAFDAWLAQARATLGPDRAELAYDRGRHTTLDDAISLAEEATKHLAPSAPEPLASEGS